MTIGYPSIERACEVHRSWTLKGPNAYRVAAMMEVLGWNVEYVELGGNYGFEIRGDESEPEHVALAYYRRAIKAIHRFDELMAHYGEQEENQTINEKPEPVVKPEPVSNMAMAVRNLIGLWKTSGIRTPVTVTHLTERIISKLSDDDLKHLFPKYRREDSGVLRGIALEEGLRDINAGLHTDQIVCTHGNGRRFFLKRIM